MNEQSVQHVLRCPCRGAHFEPLHLYEAPPEGEVRFDSAQQGTYRRALRRCAACAHVVSVEDLLAQALYSQEYVSSTYGGDAGMRRSFERIVALPPERSDNAGRVEAVVAFGRRHFARRTGHVPSILDVGSGLCVFLHRLKAVAGWRCVALDPDARAVAHAREVAGVEAVHGDFTSDQPAQGLERYDVITFNKVLEHVLDPVEMLARSARYLAPGGFVYVEVPDGEAAWSEGPGREEFFIDHHHVFSAASLSLLVARAGFRLLALERLREPSTKLTLRAFAAAT